MTDHPDAEGPDASELMQREPEDAIDFPPLNVHVLGPVRTQELPRRGTQTFRTLAVKAGVPQDILGNQPSRAQATIIATTDDFWIGKTRGDVDTSTSVPSAAVLWPPSVPFTTESTAKLFVNSTADQTISVVVENWED